MDKRTLLFLICVSITLFLVNIYFDRSHQDDVAAWHTQQRSLKEQKEKSLEEEIKGQTILISSLPLVKMYSDAQGNDFLTYAIEYSGTFFALSDKPSMPNTAYQKVEGEDKLVPVSLKYDQQILHGLTLYQSTSTELIPTALISAFGSYPVQILSSDLQNPEILRITPATYKEGRLVIPADELVELRKELGEEKSVKPSETLTQNGLALVKTPKGFIPAAVYEFSTKMLIPFEQIASLNPLLQKPEVKTSTQKKGQEQYFVLENEYQQLVFSTVGGALAEINLPFESKGDKESVVKEIDFDREMIKQQPQNAKFPAHPYFTPGASPTEFIEHKEGKLGGYYPLLRRDLIEPLGRQSIKIAPQFYALNIVSEYPELAELVFEVKSFDEKSIVFEAQQSHRRITKTYSIEEEQKGAPYVLNLTINIEGDGRGLWLTSGVPEVEWISGAAAPALKFRITRNQKSEVNVIDPPQDALTVTSVYPDWICNSNGFLGMILDPLSEINPGYRAQQVSGTVVPSRLIEIDQQYEKFKAQNLPGYTMMLPLKAEGGTMKFRVFAGPFSNRILKEVDQTFSNPATGYNPDYIACQTFHGWFAFISEPFAKFLFILMQFFHQLTGSWGLSIILLTVALRVMLFPLNAWSTKSMLNMQHIAPEVAAIQEKYKKDPKKAQMEVMALYRERGVNPVSGCLPLLIQMPFLIGMFDLLKSTFELRGACFIPGWIDDLTAPDVLFSWGTPIFFIGNQFHLLPILLGVVMFLQQKLMSTAPKDPKLMTDQQRQQQAMGTMMTFVFTIMFYHFPSGLNIYWLSSMLLGIGQQWWTNRRFKAAASTTPALKK